MDNSSEVEHKITVTMIWELLRKGKSFDTLLQMATDEEVYWIQEYRKRLQDKFNTIKFDPKKVDLAIWDAVKPKQEELIRK